MIVDWLVSFLKATFTPVIDTLPQGHLSLGDPTGLASSLAGLDSLVPVMIPIQIGLGMLGLLAVFLVVRVVQWLVEVIVP